MRMIQQMAQPSLPATRRSVECADNLATERNVVQHEWEACSTFPTCAPGVGTAAMADPAPPSTYLISSHPAVNSTASSVPQGLNRDVGSMTSNDIYTLPGQVNLATGSNVGNGFDSGEAQYRYPSEFNPAYVQSFYQQYAGITPTNSSGGAEIPTPSGVSSAFAYAYVPSPSQLTTGGGVVQQEQVSSFDNFEQEISGPLLETQALNEIYLDGSQGDSLPFGTSSQDHYALSTMSQGHETSHEGTQHARHPFTAFVNTPTEYMNGYVVDQQDARSSIAYSSPSIASHNSSPRSMMYDGSMAGMSPLHFDNIYSRHSAPPLGRRPTPLENHSSNSSPGPDTSFQSPPKRERRGAISQQGKSASAVQAKHPMLEDSVARQLYSDNFKPDACQSSDDDSSTPSLSPATLLEPDFPPTATGPLMATRERDVTNSDARISSVVRPALKLGEHHSAPASASISSPSSSGLSSGRYRPYPRTTRVTVHEQVIQFDNGSAADLSDEHETSRRTGKKSRGPKRCYCDYVCPVKNEPCGKSVSREADLGRHLSRHKAAEAEMVTTGLLAPERATQFGELKPTGAAVCEGCGTPMSRKDALKRHLRKAGKACKIYYPEVVL